MTQPTSVLMILFLSGFSLNVFGQICFFEDDYSTPDDWTQVGSLVSVSDGVVQFEGGSPGGEQRRIYKSIGSELGSTGLDCWELRCEFTPQELGTYFDNPFVGHYIAGLTAGTQEPLYDCPDIPCTGYPTGNQDGIIVVASADNPPTGDTYISLRVKDGTDLTTSDNIIFGTLNITYYIKLKRSSTTLLELSVFSDDLYSDHIPGSPIEMEIPATVEGLSYLQHGVSAGADYRRELTGYVDNTCLARCNQVGLSKTSFDLDLTVYPNPATDMINIKSSTANISAITVVSPNGQTVVDITFDYPQHHCLISTESIAVGVYFLRIKMGDAIETRKLILQERH